MSMMKVLMKVVIYYTREIMDTFYVKDQAIVGERLKTYLLGDLKTTSAVARCIMRRVSNSDRNFHCAHECIIYK